MTKDENPNNRRKRNNDPYDFFNRFFNRSSQDIFDLFEEHIKQMQQDMNNQSPNNPRIYGWSYHVGPDGKPHFKEYNNTKELPHQEIPQHKNPQLSQEKTEPYIDVIEDEKEIYITVETPGVEKENIDVKLNENTLSLDVKHLERGFKKEVQLPAAVKKKPVEATYNNGILSITLKKQKDKKKGNKINID